MKLLEDKGVILVGGCTKNKKGWDEKDWPLGVTVILIHINGTFDLARRLNSMYLKEIYEKAQSAKQQKKK